MLQSAPIKPPPQNRIITTHAITGYRYMHARQFNIQHRKPHSVRSTTPCITFHNRFPNLLIDQGGTLRNQHNIPAPLTGMQQPINNFRPVGILPLARIQPRPRFIYQQQPGKLFPAFPFILAPTNTQRFDVLKTWTTREDFHHRIRQRPPWTHRSRSSIYGEISDDAPTGPEIVQGHARCQGRLPRTGLSI